MLSLNNPGAVCQLDEQKAYRRLAVFRGGFDLEAARSVAGATVRGMMALTNKSFLTRNPATGRYQIHRLLRQYAEEELVRHNELGTFQRKHAEYYADLGEKIDQELREPNELPWYVRMGEENGNFLAALDWSLAQEHDPVIGGRLFGALGMRWFVTDNSVDGPIWMERSLKIVDLLPLGVRGRVYNRAGLVGCVLGKYARAAEHHAHAAQLFRQTGDDGFLAYALLAQANMTYSAGDPATAFPLVEESLNIAYRAEDPWFLAAALSVTASFARRKGDNRRARRLVLERVRITETFQNNTVRYGTLRSESFMARHDGKHDLSLVKFEEALALARAFNWHSSELDTLQEMAYTYYLLGDLDNAEAYFSDSLGRCREINHFSQLSWTLVGLGTIALHRQNIQEAMLLFSERLRLKLDEEFNWQIALSLAGMGKLAWLNEDARSSRTVTGRLRSFS